MKGQHYNLSKKVMHDKTVCTVTFYYNIQTETRYKSSILQLSAKLIPRMQIYVDFVVL